MRIRIANNHNKLEKDFVILDTPFDGSYCYRKDDDLNTWFVYSNSPPDNNGHMSRLAQLKMLYTISFWVMVFLLILGMLVVIIGARSQDMLLFALIWFPVVLVVCVPTTAALFGLHEKFFKYKYTAYAPTQQADNIEKVEE